MNYNTPLQVNGVRKEQGVYLKGIFFMLSDS